MASPTWAEITAQFKLGVDVIEDARVHYDGTQIAQLDAMVQTSEGDYLPYAYAAWAAVERAQFSGSVSPARAQALVYPFLAEVCKLAGFPDIADVAEMFQRVYDYMYANTYTFKYRNMSFGAVSAGGSNTGTGTINRLTKDERNYNTENGHGELKTARCTSDGNISGGQRNGETFEIYGVNASKDDLGVAGSGEAYRRRAVYGAHCGGGNGGSLLSNASFSSFSSGGTVTTKFPGWTIDTLANVTQNTSVYYRSYPGASTDASLQFDGNAVLSQKLSVQGTKLKQRAPYYLQGVYNRQTGSGDGTLTIRMGSQSTAVVLAAQTGWNIIRIALGQANWYRTFVEDDLDITVELASRSTGYVLFDDFVFVEMDNFDGSFYTVVGGATPFRLDDSFTWTDAVTLGTGKCSDWIYRATGRVLPFSNSPSVTDP